MTNVAELTRPEVVRMWTIQDLSEFLTVPVKTLYVWRTKDYGPAGIRVGRYIRYDPEDVYAWVASQKQKAA